MGWNLYSKYITQKSVCQYLNFYYNTVTNINSYYVKNIYLVLITCHAIFKILFALFHLIHQNNPMCSLLNEKTGIDKYFF